MKIKNLVVCSFLILGVITFSGCESEEQKAARFEAEMRKSMQEVNELRQKADDLQNALDKYEDAKGK